jgi:hypothetical protein
MYLPARVGNRSSIADFFPDGKSRIFSAALRAAPILIYQIDSPCRAGAYFSLAGKIAKVPSRDILSLENSSHGVRRWFNCP